MGNLKYDADYVKAMGPMLNGPHPPIWRDALQLREMVTNAVPMILSSWSPYEDVQNRTYTFESFAGAQINLTRFATPTSLAASPAQSVLYVHGGGMVAGSVEIFAPLIARYASASDVPVFAVSWRVAPEHPAPCGIEDCFAALKYMSDNATDLNIDASRIIILGDSAGAGVAASTALVARDRQLYPPLAKQILTSPMLDDRTTISQDDPLSRFLKWRNSDNVLCWDAYLGKDRGKPGIELPLHAAAGRTLDLKGLPPTYLDVGSVDLFLNETLDYAARLTKGEVEVELHVWPGLPHGWDAFTNFSWTEKAIACRADAIRRT